MNNKIKYLVFVLSAVAILSSCKDDNIGPNFGKGGAQGASVSLKASSPVTIGMETDYAALGSANYLETAAANASQTTFGSAMTHGAVMQNDGTLNFSMPDAQMDAVSAKGLKVWGRNLCSYQGQNAAYMNNAIGGAVVMPNLATNGDFEDWPDASVAPTGWTYMNGAAYFSQGTDANAKDNYSVAIAGWDGTLGSGQWHVQLGATFPTVIGHHYGVTFDAKGIGGNTYYQGEWDNGGNPQYTGDKPLTTSWVNYAFKFGNPMVPSKTSTTITFDMAQNPDGSTVFIDNVVVIDSTALDSITNAISTPEHKIEVVDAELRNWVTAMATHYKGKVVGWDVISELLADNGAIRTNVNTSSPTATDWFVWSNYLGKNIGVTAFTLAHAADPSALLFINESGLEGETPDGNGGSYGTQKLDSLIAYVSWLKSQGAPIDGIGTEMHISINTSKAGIDYMFQKLAATGLKIRISALDVKVNANLIFDFSLTPEVLNFQAVTYHDVIASYLQYVPADQRQDITIWGVNDPNSWLYNGGTDFPLLFDENYLTKPAFDGVLNALGGK